MDLVDIRAALAAIPEQDLYTLRATKIAALLDRVASILRVEMERPDTLH